MCSARVRPEKAAVIVSTTPSGVSGSGSSTLR
jgi:hypothetical protein